MKKKVKDRWIADLRSGWYKQGRNNLRYKDKFCCLGVLCEQAVRDGVTFRTDEGGAEGYGLQLDVLPLAVRDWAELEDSTGYYQIRHDGFSSLIDDNDVHGKSFDEIADIIDKYF